MGSASPGIVLLIVVALYSLRTDALKCYSCNSDVSSSCDVVNPFNTTMKTCGQHQQYCKKKIIRSPGMYRIERGCYDMCTQQKGVEIGKQVHIDVFCCNSELCNSSTKLQVTSPMFMLLVTSALLKTYFR